MRNIATICRGLSKLLIQTHFFKCLLLVSLNGILCKGPEKQCYSQGFRHRVLRLFSTQFHSERRRFISRLTHRQKSAGNIWQYLGDKFQSRNRYDSRPPGPRVLRPFACRDCGSESRRRHGCLTVVSVVCSPVDVSATGQSLSQWCPAECGVSGCDRGTSKTKPRFNRICSAMRKNSL